MIPISLPNSVDGLLGALLEIVRRAIDGTVPPVIVDQTNQRVLIGGTAATTANTGKMEISGGDLKVVSSGYGVVIPNRAGTVYYRLIVDADGALSVDPL